MKRFLYPLLAVAGIFAVAACDRTKEEDKGDLDEVKTVFEIEEIEALLTKPRRSPSSSPST